MHCVQLCSNLHQTMPRFSLLHLYSSKVAVVSFSVPSPVVQDQHHFHHSLSLHGCSGWSLMLLPRDVLPTLVHSAHTAILTVQDPSSTVTLLVVEPHLVLERQQSGQRPHPHHHCLHLLPTGDRAPSVPPSALRHNSW
jgi:hypothetical protein